MEELRPLTAHLGAKVLPEVNAGVDGSSPSYAEVLALLFKLRVAPLCAFYIFY